MKGRRLVVTEGGPPANTGHAQPNTVQPASPVALCPSSSSPQLNAHVERLVAQLLVELALPLRHACIQDDLHLAGQAGLHIRLHAAQQEGLQDLVQLGHHLQARKERMGAGQPGGVMVWAGSNS